jgi:hypothetical protein
LRSIGEILLDVVNFDCDLGVGLITHLRFVDAVEVQADELLSMTVRVSMLSEITMHYSPAEALLSTETVCADVRARLENDDAQQHLAMTNHPTMALLDVENVAEYHEIFDGLQVNDDSHVHPSTYGRVVKS